MSEDAPFSYPVNVRTLPARGHRVSYTAEREVEQAIAEDAGLINVTGFSATAHVMRWKRDGVSVKGEVSARVTQPSAVTAEPIEVGVHEEIDLVFVPSGSKLARPDITESGELVVDPDGPDLPETFEGDSVDLASVWLEFFVLGLDLFAREKGAELPSQAAESENSAESSPFSALSKLKSG